MLIPRVTALFLLFFAGMTGLFAQPSTNRDSLAKKPVAVASSGIEKPIDYKASDSIIFDIRKNKVFLFRNAELNYGDIHLKAHYIEVDLNRKELFAKGGFDSSGYYTESLPVLEDGNDKYKCDSMRYNSKSKKGRVYGLHLIQDDAVIHLDKVMKQEDGSFIGDRGKITTCTDEHPHFFFNAHRIKVIPNNKAVFGSANLVVADVPTPLAVPFGIAPLKKGRRNGILIPAYGYNYSNKTFYLQKLGYYMGLGPRADLTLTTDLYLNGDLRAGIATNLIKRYKYRGGLQFSASRMGNGTERTSPYFKHVLDFSLMGNFAFDQKMLPGTTLKGDVHIQTANYNKINSRDLNSIAQNIYTSSITYSRGFLRNKINLNTSARHSQNTQTHAFRMELPNLTLAVPRITPFAGSGGCKWYQQLWFGYNMNLTNVLNTVDTLLFSKRGSEEFKNLQNGIAHSFSSGTNFKLLKGLVNLSPSFGYNEQWYFKTTTREWDKSTQSLKTTDNAGFYRMQKYNVTVSASTNVYGTYQGLHIGKIRAIRHTITPSISANFAPEVNPSTLGWVRAYMVDTGTKNIIHYYNIFEKGNNGYYRQGKTGAAGFSIQNNVSAKRVVGVDSNGKEKTEKVNLIDALNFSGNYNALADSLKFSDLSISLNTTLFKLFTITAGSHYSPYALNYAHNRYNKFQFAENKKLLRFVDFNSTVGAKFSADDFKKEKRKSKKAHTSGSGTEAEVEDLKRNETHYYNFNIPWSINFNYVLVVNQEQALRNKTKPLSTHTISAGGDINLTSEWKVGYQVNYDILKKTVVAGQYTVSRNLHCWQLDFNYVPGKFWYFTLRPKSGLLQDLKLNKRVWQDPNLFGAY